MTVLSVVGKVTDKPLLDGSDFLERDANFGELMRASLEFDGIGHSDDVDHFDWEFPSKLFALYYYEFVCVIFVTFCVFG